MGLYMYDAVVKKFTSTFSSPDEFLVYYVRIHCGKFYTVVRMESAFSFNFRLYRCRAKLHGINVYA